MSIHTRELFKDEKWLSQKLSLFIILLPANSAKFIAFQVLKFVNSINVYGVVFNPLSIESKESSIFTNRFTLSQIQSLV